MKDTFILNNVPIEKKIINGYKNFFGEKIEGKFIKVGSAYCPIKELKNKNIDNWLKEKLR